MFAASLTLAQMAPEGPPPAVTTAVVEAREVGQAAEFIGRVDAILSYDARARVEGFLQQVAFREGAHVQAGDLLFVIEPEPYQAALAAARAQLARAEAQKEAAQRSYARLSALYARGTAPQSQLDEATAARDSAAADVLAAQAAVQMAKLDVGYTRVTSPISGRIGATAVTQGNLVGPNSGVLARVVQLDPVRVVFSVSDRDLLSAQQRLGVQSPEELIQHFAPALRLPNDRDYREPGRLEFIDNRIDPNTGTVAVRAVFANPQELLLPGEFVTVHVRSQYAERRPLVPVSAVQQDRQGRYVLVLDGNNRVEQRRIETGPQIDQRWVVEKGLREGETIVVEGQQKVLPGMVVQPTPQSEPTRG